MDKAQEKRLHEAIQQRLGAGRQHSRYTDYSSILNLLMTFRLDVVPKFISECVNDILSCEPKLVGLTCLFDQTIASVGIAKKLKEVAPELPVVLGGYALEGPPGRTVAAAFPWVDLIVTGDGEQIIVDLAQDALEGRRLAHTGTSSSRVVSTPKFDLMQSPSPDYRDWFRDLRQLAEEHKVKVTTDILPVESSRGCWWGQSQHCVFCGIDDETLKYRQKTPERTLSMLTDMRQLYGDAVFRFSDYIMPKSYYTELLPALARQRSRFRLHSEIKANHPPERLKMLADAGFHEIQPGIESFSTSVLKEMHKGVRAIDNVSLLKAGYQNRITINYNILYGLPHDSLEDYIEMLKRIPRLYHLIPPASCTETVVTRFAPLHSDPARFGISIASHHPCYDIIFSSQYLTKSGFNLDLYAYYFERPFDYSPELKLVYSQLCQQVSHWKMLHRRQFVELSFEINDNIVSVTDTRYPILDKYSLSVAGSAIYLACTDRPINIERLRNILGMVGKDSTERIFAEGLEELEEKRLIWTERGLILGLAVPKAISDARTKDGWCQTWKQIYC